MTRAQACDLLDRVRVGMPVPRPLIDEALRMTGDLSLKPDYLMDSLIELLALTSMERTSASYST